MNARAVISIAAILPCIAHAGALRIVVSVPIAEEIEITEGDDLCVWPRGQVESFHVQGLDAFKSLRDGKSGYCVPGRPAAYRITTRGTEIRLEVGDIPSTSKALPAKSAAAGSVAPAREDTANPAATSSKTPAAAPLPAAVTGDTKAVEDNYKRYTVDVAIPDSPAFAVMNVTPSEVVRPSTPRTWTAAILDGVDKNGKLKKGVAMDAAPYALFNTRMSLYEYTRLGALEKALMNTNLSLGTAKGSESNDKSLKIGIGLHVRLYDRGDPREDTGLLECYRNAASKGDSDDFFKPSVDTPAAGEKFKECLAKRKGARWNASSGILGWGHAWNSDTGEWKDRKGSTRAGWLTLGYGFEEVRGLKDNAQVLMHLKGLDRERVADPLNAGKFVDQDNRTAALQLRFGVETFAGMVESSWQRLSIPGREEERLRRYAVGFELRIAPNTWLVASTGSEIGRKNGENNSFVLGTIRIGSATASTFGPSGSN